MKIRPVFRNIWVYYVIFFSGVLTFIYESNSWNLVGDSVNFLCLLFVLNAFFVKVPSQILGNAILMTEGYILPLLIRNSLKLSHAEAPLTGDFFRLATTSILTTLAIGLAITSLAYLLKLSVLKLVRMSRGKITLQIRSKDF